MPTSLPAVTVVITLYNREAFIAESIESVLVQTWRDFELIVVDDCSTDRSYEIACGYQSDARVRVVKNERNLGDYANRNHAASLAKGEFLKFHDSDDVMYPHCLEFMVRPLIAEPAAAFALTSSRTWQGGPVPMLLTPELAFEREFHGNGLFGGGPANALFRTDSFIAEGGFKDVGAASDHLFWLRYCATHAVLLVHADLFYYRLHSGQEPQSSRRAAESFAYVHGLVWRFLSDGHSPLKGASLERARRNWLWWVFRESVRDARVGRFNLIQKRLSAGRIGLRDWIRYVRPASRSLTAGTPPISG